MDCGIDDIEELGETPIDRIQHNLVVPKSKPVKSKKEEKIIGKIPHTEKVYVKTWGCSHNNSDGEYMAGQLVSAGYTLTDQKEDADLWLLNSCTVKDPSQTTFINAIKVGTGQGKRVVLAGCVPQAAPKHKDLNKLSMIGVQQIDRVVEVVEQTLEGNTVQLLGIKKSGGAALDLPKIRKNRFVEVIPINTGCLNQCTYCKTKQARGDLRSYPVEEIVNRAKQVIEEGVVEIWLTSEDTGTYGRDIGTSLPKLLWALIEVLETDPGVRLRVGMTNPPYILEHLEEMAKILNHPQVYRFLHVPVQAASDRVLEDMRRKYTCAEYCEVVDYLLEKVPNMTIATDIICGFPTETEKDFQETLDLVEKYKFPVVNISQFYPRPGTPAARMKRIITSEVKRRSRLMTDLFKSYQNYNHLIGTTQRILVTDVAHDGTHYVGHNISYEQILIPGDEKLMGKLIDVKITSTSSKFSVFGEIIPESLEKIPIRPIPPLSGQLSKPSSIVLEKKKLQQHSSSSCKSTSSSSDCGDCGSSGGGGCGEGSCGSGSCDCFEEGDHSSSTLSSSSSSMSSTTPKASFSSSSSSIKSSSTLRSSSKTTIKETISQSLDNWRTVYRFLAIIALLFFSITFILRVTS